MSEPLHIISLGAGVQSSTMALMAACGEITPMPTGAIFADTGDEPAKVYEWLDWLEKQLPFPVHRVREPRFSSLAEAATTTKTNQKTGKPYCSNMVPAYIKNPDGSRGVVERHCTYNFKLVPLRRKIKELAKIKRAEKEVGVISWIGISYDEIQRMKPSRDRWCHHRFPLVDLRMRREDCLKWMLKHGYPQPPRSACVYCPYHHAKEWHRLKTEEPAEFAKAVKFEQDLQALHARMTDTPGRIRGIPFLHNSLKPLSEIDFNPKVETKEPDLFTNECEGMCGV